MFVGALSLWGLVLRAARLLKSVEKEVLAFWSADLKCGGESHREEHFIWVCWNYHYNLKTWLFSLYDSNSRYYLYPNAVPCSISYIPSPWLTCHDRFLHTNHSLSSNWKPKDHLPIFFCLGILRISVLRPRFCCRVPSADNTPLEDPLRNLPAVSKQHMLNCWSILWILYHRVFEKAPVSSHALWYSSIAQSRGAPVLQEIMIQTPKGRFFCNKFQVPLLKHYRPIYRVFRVLRILLPASESQQSHGRSSQFSKHPSRPCEQQRHLPDIGNRANGALSSQNIYPDPAHITASFQILKHNSGSILSTSGVLLSCCRCHYQSSYTQALPHIPGSKAIVSWKCYLREYFSIQKPVSQADLLARIVALCAPAFLTSSTIVSDDLYLAADVVRLSRVQSSSTWILQSDSLSHTLHSPLNRKMLWSRGTPGALYDVGQIRSKHSLASLLEELYEFEALSSISTILEFMLHQVGFRCEGIQFSRRFVFVPACLMLDRRLL